MKKDLIYALTCLAFSVIIGGAVYEHLNVVPTWAAAPPVSLSMFQGEYGLKPDLFWKIIHPVNLVLFSVTLILHWRSARRKTLVIVLTSYVVILVITAIYFVPELISIITTASAATPDARLISRAGLWETLSLARLAVLVLLALQLFIGFTKSRTSTPGVALTGLAAQRNQVDVA